MSSVSGLITTPGTGAYNASKYAIESLGDALRMELRPWNIRVSLIEPGPIRTDMWGGALDEYDTMTARLSDQHRSFMRRISPALANSWAACRNSRRIPARSPRRSTMR